jgi:hypothetical protein
VGVVAHLRTQELHAVVAVENLRLTGAITGTVTTATTHCAIADMGWPAIDRADAEFDAVVAGRPVRISVSYPVGKNRGSVPSSAVGVYGVDGVTNIRVDAVGSSPATFNAVSGSVAAEGLHGSVRAQLQPPVLYPGWSMWDPPRAGYWLTLDGTWSC